MAIEVAPQKEERPLWQVLLFYFSVLLLVLSLALFLILKMYFIPKFDNEIKDMEDQTAKQNQSVFEGKTIGSIEEEVKSAEAKIKDFKILYQERMNVTNFFQELEKSVHPKVYFANLSLSLGDEEEMKAVLSGQTESFKSLIQQIEILQRKTNFIKNFNVSNIGMAEEGGVSFELTLNLRPSIFNLNK
ncbi:MAG: hypothetical protein WCX23_00095 [Candidatus Paceibacterota bacterium]|jgi:hypothetical protein|nr:hypothetical protein [Candidatus Paceibacterota bacterium]MDD4830877.1 hypothetical protein [Candidatus Paceibacterota bacterium]MDD4875332.1 hypothetical protein [Candidatus Paceibacterota bacterium]